MPKRYVRGDRAFGRLVKQLPDSVTKEIRAQLNQTGSLLLSLAHRRVAKLTGALDAGLTMRIPPVRLQLKVGIIGKGANRKLYYGHIVEFGRKASTVTVTRVGTLARAKAAGLGVRANNYKAAALAAGISGSYQLHVKAMPARHFIYVASRDQIYAPYRAIWGNALRTASAGAGDD